MNCEHEWEHYGELPIGLFNVNGMHVWAERCASCKAIRVTARGDMVAAVTVHGFFRPDLSESIAKVLADVCGTCTGTGVVDFGSNVCPECNAEGSRF